VIVGYLFSSVSRYTRSIGCIISRVIALLLISNVSLLVQPQEVFAAQGDAITLRKVTDSLAEMVNDDAAPVDKLATLEEEAIARVNELSNVVTFETTTEDSDWIPIPLAKLMHMAVETNPMLKAERAKVVALEQQVIMAGAPMEPKMNFMLMDVPVIFPWELENSMVREKLGISQMFSSYGKRASREKIAAYDVELQKLKVEQAEYNMAGSVITMYFSLVRNAVDIDTLERRDALLSVMEDIARVRYELNKAPLADVLMVQTMRAELDAMRADLEQMRGAMVSELAGMIGISDIELEIELEDVKIFNVYEPDDSDALWLAAFSRHPELKWLETLDQQGAERESLAKKGYHPDYQLSMDYTYSYEMDDRLSFEVMFNLPIYQKFMQDPAYKEASAMRAEIPLMEEDLLNRIRSKGQVELSKIRLLEPKVAQYRQNLIPLAKTTFDSVLASYQVGMMGLSELIQTEVTLLDFESQLRLAYVDAAEARAKLYYITLGTVVGGDSRGISSETPLTGSSGGENVGN
jgi:outer membrane protein TolC